MSLGLLVLCVCAAVLAGWWVGAQARERANQPKTLAGKARDAATRGLTSILKQLVSREREEGSD
jgi:hypothetical protein